MAPHHFFIFLAVLALSGCAASHELQEMKQAKAAYQACLKENPKNVSACKHEKENYEAAGLAYDSLKP